ncbi:MAG: ATP-binding protein [Bacteroidota bacterium]
MSFKVTHKLALSFFLIALLVGGIGYLAVTLGQWVERDADALGANSLIELERAYAMIQAAQASQATVQQVLIESAEAPEGEAATLARETLTGHLSVFGRQLAQSREYSPRETTLGAIRQAFGTYQGQAERLAALSATDPAEASTIFYEELEPFYLGTFQPVLSQRAGKVQETLEERADRVERTGVWAGRIGVSASALLLFIVLVLGIYLTRFVGRSLRELTAAARAIGEGRLDERVEITSNNEIGQLGRAINEMMDQFSSTTVSKGYVENIVQSMADPLVVVDPNVKISMVNQAALDMLGFERSDLLGKAVMAIFAHTGRNRGVEIKQTIEQALTGNVETSFRAKAGTGIPVSLSSALVRDGSEVQGLVIVAKDITKQKQFETELIEAKEEAEQMVHLRDAFLANMSHEIRTPLTGILGSAQVLAEGVEGEHKNLAKIIEDAGTRLLDTINSVLEMARIEAGEVQPEVEVLNVFEEAEASARVLKQVADKRGLLLRVEPADKPVYAQIDRSCLHRILNNLIGNAIKFTREGAVSVEVEATDEEAILTVRDTGVGISKQFLPHLFDDFKQESTGLKRSHEGSGLGLAITKKLVEMMGGEISVESIKGIGSAFSIRFPRVPVEQVPETLPAGDRPEEPESSEPSAARYPWETEEMATSRSEELTFASPPAPDERMQRDILLIEDNAQNAYMAQFMLQDYETDIATSPEEAIEQARYNQYRILLVDINLGADRSGIDLLHEIRGIEGYERVPAVAVTAYALPGDEDRFLREGFDDYVAKPFRKEVLLASVEDALVVPEENDGPNLETLLDGSFDDASTFNDAVFDQSVVPTPPEAAPADLVQPPADLVQPPADLAQPPADLVPEPALAPDDVLITAEPVAIEQIVAEPVASADPVTFADDTLHADDAVGTDNAFSADGAFNAHDALRVDDVPGLDNTFNAEGAFSVDDAFVLGTEPPPPSDETFRMDASAFTSTPRPDDPIDPASDGPSGPPPPAG